MIARSTADLRDALAPARRAGRTIGFVPTMGALHDGHRALIERARDEHDVVVVSVFVNPTQFEDPADLAAYPRLADADARGRVRRRRGRRLRPGRRGGLPRRVRDDGDGPRPAHRDARGRPSRHRPLRRRHHRRGQAAHDGRPRRRLLRAQGRPAGGRRDADDARPEPSGARSSSARPSATPTGWRSPAATPGSRRTSASGRSRCRAPWAASPRRSRPAASRRRPPRRRRASTPCAPAAPTPSTSRPSTRGRSPRRASCAATSSC